MGISVVINTYNEAKNLQECLDSVKGFDEIVVCDMESTDETVEIARRNGCKTIIFPKGSHTICEPARNTAIQSASNPAKIPETRRFGLAGHNTFPSHRCRTHRPNTF